MILLTENLRSSHKIKEFTCGSPMLDNYLKHQASQDIKKKLTACFVYTEHEVNLVKGYYTLSNNSIPSNLIPVSFRKQIPKSYSSIPATLLGRLAVDIKYQGQGMGKALLIDALKRSFLISKSIGSFAVVLDPLDREAEKFYEKYGFIKLPDCGRMFLPMKIINQLFEE
jgi:predicted GNAT family N-acyltransferase